MAFTYPSRDIDKPDTLLGYLGSHWSTAWDNTHQIRSLSQARGRNELQKVIRLNEAEATVSRLQSDTLHTDHWYLLILKENDRNDDSIATLRYDELVETTGVPAVYGNDPATGIEYRYGVGQQDLSAFPTPTDLKEAPFITNRITESSLVLTSGLDYFIDELDGAIVFRDNPFDNPLVVVDDIYKDGVVVDRQARLWVFRARFDENTVFNHFGYVVGVNLESGQTYLDFVNSIWDAAVEGTGGKQIEDAFAALTDTPIVRTASEVVQHIQADVRHLLIITDVDVYRYPLNAVAIVSVGDTVQAGDQLVDTVKIFEFHDGVVPPLTDLVGIEMDLGMLIDGFSGGITFNNRDEVLEVDTSGIFTRVEFEVGGFAGDTAEFWDQFHSRGIATPPTLAQLLDTRTNKVGEPGASNLPATINPLEFLIQNVLRNNGFAVKIKVNRQGENALPLGNSRQLRKMVPPHTAMIILLELAVEEEMITMDGSGTDTEAGFEEAPALIPALEPVTEEVIDAASFITEAPSLKHTEGVCL